MPGPRCPAARDAPHRGRPSGPPAPPPARGSHPRQCPAPAARRPAPLPTGAGREGGWLRSAGPQMNGPLLPGAAVGVLGGGQLGRMLTLAARRMGYRVHVFSPDADSPAGRVSNREWDAQYDDLEAVRGFGRSVDAVTLEFENIPAETVEELSSLVPVRPGLRALRTTQNRLREKEFLRGAGFPVAAFRGVADRASLAAAVEEVGVPAVLKTAGFGYDGKGQTRISTPEDADAAWDALGGEAVLEAWGGCELGIPVGGGRGGRGRRGGVGGLREGVLCGGRPRARRVVRPLRGSAEHPPQAHPGPDG